MMTLIISLISIILLYFLVAWLRDGLYKIFHFKPCAICAAVSLTWLGLLVWKFSGGEVDVVVVALLMGGSIVGLMYKAEKWLIDFGYFWLLRLFIVLGGVSMVYFLLIQQWFLFFILIIIGLLVAFWFYISYFNKQEKLTEKKEKTGQAIKELKKKMENCCD